MPKDPKQKSAVIVLVRLLLRYPWRVLLGVGGLLVVDALQTVVPKVTQVVIDRLTQGVATPSSLVLLGLGVVGAAIGMGMFRFVWRFFLVGAANRIERAIRQDLYDHLRTMPAQFFDRTKAGDLMSLATNDTYAIRRAIGYATMSAADSAFLIAITLCMMCSYSVHLTLVTLIPLPLLGLLMWRFGTLIHSRFDRVQAAFSGMSDKAQETFSGIRVVKAYGGETAENADFARRARVYVDENIGLARAWAVFDPLIAAVSMTSVSLLLWFGGRAVIDGTITVGGFVAFATYLHMLVWPMMAVGAVVNLLQRGGASMARIQSVLDTQPAVVDGQRDDTPEPDIACKGLTFTYPGGTAPVVHDINFSLPAGGTLGIVGRTGSGKTTLARLLLRVYDPPHGTLRLGGHDVTDLRLARVRATFGYVPQEPFLFAMSVEDNIRFGAPGLTHDKVEALARCVNLHDEILGFPQGYDTIVGERGITLSGGQKQRVAIARALALSPRILILDDALSAVDAETETAILAHLADATAKMTCIVIAHRVSAIRSTDQILVVESGGIVDRGTHADLAAREGYYADLFRLQSLEAAEAAAVNGGAA